MTGQAAKTSPKDALQASYDRVAAEYAARISDELAHKPLDRALLDCFAEQVRGRGVVGDVGCGPGHVTRYLHERGVAVTGIDLSPAMVAIARERNPSVDFQQADMLALSVPEGAWAGMIAFYSIIHLPPKHVPAALREFHRVLRPGGLLLLAFHVGDKCVHLDEWWGHPVSIDSYFLGRAAVEQALEETGFRLEASVERRPYSDAEYPSQRAYLLARKPN